eukprot:6501860-Karenia_brevis.AAC.1
MGSGDRKLENESTGNYVLSLAKQKASRMQHRPSDVLGVDEVGGNNNGGAAANTGGQEQQGNQEYWPWWWGDDVGAINNTNIQ